MWRQAKPTQFNSKTLVAHLFPLTREKTVSNDDEGTSHRTRLVRVRKKARITRPKWVHRNDRVYVGRRK